MPPKKKAANGYKFAEPLPKGTVLEDITKVKWKLGPTIGKGGFGEIYSAQTEGAKGNNYPYVVKIEPHANGPLFVENNFYIRYAKQADIDEFKKSRGLKSLGMPVYLGSGSIDYKSEKYRFLVMEKFGTDLHKLYMDNGKKFPTHTVFQIGVQILDTLEYIHSKGYVHADIKGANILMGATKDTQNKQVYLVDFGLATKYSTEKEFKPNPKKAHDGTIEYLSRDAHQGVQTRRGDLEILAYNMIHWLGCTLPWESNLKDPKIVQQSKEEHMKDASAMVKACFKSGTVAPKAMVDFLKYLQSLKFDTEPDYKKIRKIFIAGVKETGGSIDSNLTFFSSAKSPTKRKGTPANEAESPKKSRNGVQNEHSDIDEDPGTSKKAPARKRAAKKGRVEDKPVEIVEPTKRTRKAVQSEQPEVDEEAGPSKRPPPRRRGGKDVDENLIGLSANLKAKRPSPRARAKEPKETPESTDESNQETDGNESEDDYSSPINRITVRKKPADKELVVKVNENGMDGYTEAMKQIMNKMQNDPKKKGSKKVAATKKTEVAENGDDNMEGFNDGMKETATKKNPRRNAKKNETPDASEKAESNMEGFNDEMKEIATKKNPRRNAKKNETPDGSEKGDSDMEDFNDEMKEIAMKKKPRRNAKKNETPDGSEKGESDMEGFNDEMKEIAMKKKPRRNAKKNVTPDGSEKGESDMEGFNDEMKEIAMKKKPIRNAKKNETTEGPEKGESDMEGFNDGMKEIAMKKNPRRNATKKETSEKGALDMEGYNDEMKEIASKKRVKRAPKSKDPIPVATTSKAKAERGLVKPNSKRLVAKPPPNHLDVVQNNGDSQPSD